MTPQWQDAIGPPSTRAQQRTSGGGGAVRSTPRPKCLIVVGEAASGEGPFEPAIQKLSDNSARRRYAWQRR
jgi:hypothetical protein